MNCEWVQNNIALYLYGDGELADDARHELEQHISRCEVCAKELAEQQKFHALMDAIPVEEISPSFLTAARMQLQEALEQTQQRRAWYQRFTFDPAAWLRQVRLSPALATLIFTIGFGGGLGAMYRSMTGHTAQQASIFTQAPPSAQSTEASIGGITSIERDPNSDKVKVQYQTVQPQVAQGSTNDPAIRNLLLYGTKDPNDSSVRMNSVDALRSKTDDEQVRATLTYLLRYDSNPGVRLQALDALAPYVKQDIRVRNAVLDSLLNDSNPGVRVSALKWLEPVKTDSSVRMALQQLSKEDPNLSIRNGSKQILASLPEMY
jgi:anti-sigma factor RsiW